MKNITCRHRLILLALLCTPLPLLATPHNQPKLGHQSAPLLTQAGLQFKDLNNAGHLSPYEEWRLSAAQRASDLLERMTLEEKVGLMMHGTAPVKGSAFGSGDTYDMAASEKIIRDKQVNSLYHPTEWRQALATGRTEQRATFRSLSVAWYVGISPV